MIFVAAAAAFAYCVIRLSLFCSVSFCCFLRKVRCAKKSRNNPEICQSLPVFQADHNNECVRLSRNTTKKNTHSNVCVCVKRIYAFAQIAQPEIPELAAAQPARPAQVLYGVNDQEKEKERESDRAY